MQHGSHLSLVSLTRSVASYCGYKDTDSVSKITTEIAQMTFHGICQCNEI